METRLTLRPGRNGTRKLAERFGKRFVNLRIGYGEESQRAKLKALGALWRPQHKLWELPWGVARGLDLEDRVIQR
jgi:hypothetical protein